jgi:hypothetical protein
MQNHFNIQTSKCFTVFQEKQKEKKKKTRSKPEELLLKISLHRVFSLHNLFYKSQQGRRRSMRPTISAAFEPEKLPCFLSLSLSLSVTGPLARWLAGRAGARDTKRPSRKPSVQP